RRHRIARPLYLGGGGLPLLDRAGLAEVAARVAALESGVIANNLYSADVVGFAPGAAIEAIDPPARDNALCGLLRQQAGLPAEERGMEADGRLERGRVRSLLGYYLEVAGSERFFATLADLGDAAFLDTRVLFSHRGRDVSRADRFWSDLGRVEEIADPFVREF